MDIICTGTSNEKCTLDELILTILYAMRREIITVIDVVTIDNYKLSAKVYPASHVNLDDLYLPVVYPKFEWIMNLPIKYGYKFGKIAKQIVKRAGVVTEVDDIQIRISEPVGLALLHYYPEGVYSEPMVLELNVSML